MNVDVQVNANVAKDRLERLLVAFGNMNPAWNDVAKVISDIVKRNFDAGGRPPWPERKKGKHGPKGRHLRVTGELYERATHPLIESNGDRAVYRAIVGKKGVALHYGTSGTVDVPEHEQTIVQAFGRMLVRAVSFKVRSHGMKMNLKPRPYFTVPYGYGEEGNINGAISAWLWKAGAPGGSSG
jgi:phage gpG-like protein